MKSISGKHFCKVIERKGWVLKRVSGSHYICEKIGVAQILSIPVHRDQDLKIGTLKALMKVAQLSEEDLF